MTKPVSTTRKSIVTVRAEFRLGFLPSLNAIRQGAGEALDIANLGYRVSDAGVGNVDDEIIYLEFPIPNDYACTDYLREKIAYGIHCVYPYAEDISFSIIHRPWR